MFLATGAFIGPLALSCFFIYTLTGSRAGLSMLIEMGKFVKNLCVFCKKLLNYIRGMIRRRYINDPEGNMVLGKKRIA
jgi:hypothetical protein